MMDQNMLSDIDRAALTYLGCLTLLALVLMYL